MFQFEPTLLLVAQRSHHPPARSSVVEPTEPWLGFLSSPTVFVSFTVLTGFKSHLEGTWATATQVSANETWFHCEVK